MPVACTWKYHRPDSNAGSGNTALPPRKSASRSAPTQPFPFSKPAPNLISPAPSPAFPRKQPGGERALARRILQSGSDPSKRRQIERLELQLAEANTFEEVARELH